ncbi:phosphatase PAP2 family protein [Nocardia transvalensis]|uniref:phosphatase PAP2 family protein n=1 Tax=Nocardia transvalensis TaxID=37333 RepID=UPI0018960F1A|nr:phosphatase PAP2 family protein [Nocardia transvalensis]MBF6327901.1 phosphatase PAP2 family protein [Nocardia transvalensis]
MERVVDGGVGRRVAFVVAVVAGVLVTVLVPLGFPGDGGATGFDRVVGEWVHGALDAHPGVYRALVVPSNGYVLLPLLVVGAVWYAGRRQWWVVGFLLVAPEFVVAVNTWGLKPLWHRHLHDYLAYPSGHTVHFVAIATAFVLVAAETRTRVIEVSVAVVVLAGVAVGMVGLGYHYPTDVMGGSAAAVALIVAIYAVLGEIKGRRSAAPPARTTAPTRTR